MESKIIIAVVLSFITIIGGIFFYVRQTNESADGQVAESRVPALKKIHEARDDNAVAAGRAGVYAQRLYQITNGRYAVNLSELRSIDKGITSDPEVEFVFGEINEQGFTFTTYHSKGDRSFIFH